MTKIFKILLLILTITSCGESNKEPEKSKYEIRRENQKKLDTINLTKAENLSKTSDAIIGWDTTDHFTYSFQELFESDPRPVSFIGEIKDVIKKDSLYILKVMNTNSQSSKKNYCGNHNRCKLVSGFKIKVNPKRK